MSALQQSAISAGNQSRATSSTGQQQDPSNLVSSASLPNLLEDSDAMRFSESINDDIVRALPVVPSAVSLDVFNASIESANNDDPESGRLSQQQRLAAEKAEATLERLENLIIRQESASRVKCERSLRRKLRFFFMSPVEKWRKQRQFPFKLVLELIKIAIVTVQLVIFGYDRSTHLSFQEKNADALRHIFQPGYQTLPTSGIACSSCIEMYKLDQIYSSLDHLVQNYFEIEHIGVGAYLPDFDPKTNKSIPLVATITNLNISRLYNEDGIVYELDATQVTEQVVLNAPNTTHSNLRAMVERLTHIDLHRFLHMSIPFRLHGIAYHRILVSQKPSCITFYLNMEYDNWERSGLVIQQLHFTSSFERPCRANIIYFGENDLGLFWRYVVIITVMLLSLMSFILCLRSAIRSERLRRVTIVYFDKYLNRVLRWDDDGGSEFLDLWLYLIMVTDIFLLIGSVCWILLIESTSIDVYETIAVLLGIGTLLSWFSILRYLNYYQKLSLLLVTLKRATPPVLRFLLCALVFFCGYLFFGWIVLGPYSPKFKTISAASEQLFSLVNGDDMFATFSSVASDQSPVIIWAVSRVYLYSFICLYIYVVLSLFIAIIIDVYEDIKESWKSKKFRPYSQTLRQLLAGTLTRQSDADRTRIAKRLRENQESRIYFMVWKLMKRLYYLCRRSKSSSSSPSGSSGGDTAAVIKYATNIDASRYNLPRSPLPQPRAASMSHRRSTTGAAELGTTPSVTIEVGPRLMQDSSDNMTTITVISSSPSESPVSTDDESDGGLRPVGGSLNGARLRPLNQASNSGQQSPAAAPSPIQSRRRAGNSEGTSSPRLGNNPANNRPDSIFFL